MGWGQSKPQQNNVALAQSVSNETMGQRVGVLEIMVIVCAVLMGVLILYLIRGQCKKRVRGWFQKEAVAAGWSLPVVKVQAVPPPTIPRNPDVY